MPYDEVMKKFARGSLKSGGSGKTVTNPKQAVAIMYSEKRAAKAGKNEYAAAAKPVHHRGKNLGAFLHAPRRKSR